MHYSTSRNVLHYVFGRGALENLKESILSRCPHGDDYALIFVDEYFRKSSLLDNMSIRPIDQLIYLSTHDEPKTTEINCLCQSLINKSRHQPSVVVGMGGGIVLDTAKAISNLLTNGGCAEDYQGWDLVKVPGVYKIGVPTISGTGAESSRTCVMTNTKTGLKLGMNSEHTIYDALIMDPMLSGTVPRNQYFYTGLDTYIHCIESLNGRFRHAVGDAFSKQAKQLSCEVFLTDDMKSMENREKLMVASYLGGCAIANSYVGVVHPFSAALSVVLGIHHGIGNCIVMTAMEEFYPKEVEQFWKMVERQKVEIPRGLSRSLTDVQYQQLYSATVIHEKPLTNALGDNFKGILTLEKVTQIFQSM